MKKSVISATLLVLSFCLPARAASPVSRAQLSHLEDVLTSANDLSEFTIKDLDPKELPGAAKQGFKDAEKGWLPDYPADAALIKVEGQEFIVITENNDGGGCMDLYSVDGQLLASGYAGESSPWVWSN